MGNKEENGIPEGPAISDKTWFALALAGAIVTLVIFVIMAIAVFEGGEQMLVRAQTFTPFGAALIAGVTFLTVAWRGVLNTQQLKLQADQLRQQADQIAQVVRQNDTKDAEYKAKLLQDAAKLLSEIDKTAQVRAGITSLDVLVRDPHHTHSATAMNMLAEYLVHSYAGGEPSVLQMSAINVLATGEKEGVFATDPITLVAQSKSDDEHPSWPIIKGIKYLEIVGGKVIETRYAVLRDMGVFFNNVLITNINFNNETISRCTFVNCNINLIYAHQIEMNTFINCDFSYCKVIGNFYNGFFNEQSHSNYYVQDGPPRFETNIKFQKYFDVIKWKDRDKRRDRF